MPFHAPPSNRNPQLYYLSIKTIQSEHTVRCRTIALELDEAILTAQRHYGPIHLLASGTRDLSLGPEQLGAGRFLPSRYDDNLSKEYRQQLLAR